VPSKPPKGSRKRVPVYPTPKAAFLTTLEKTRFQVRGIAAHYFRQNPEEWDEISQEVASRLWENMDRIDFSKNVAGLVSRMAENICKDKIRSFHRRRQKNLTDDGKNTWKNVEAPKRPENGPDNNIAFNRIRSALAKLRPSDRELAELYLEALEVEPEQPNTFLAEKTGQRSGTIRVRLLRLRQKIKKALEDPTN